MRLEYRKYYFFLKNKKSAIDNIEMQSMAIIEMVNGSPTPVEIIVPASKETYK